MKKKIYIKLIASLLAVLFIGTLVYGDDFGDDKFKLDISGFVESENYYFTSGFDDGKNINGKDELRSKIVGRFGNDDLYIKTVANGYLYPLKNDRDIRLYKNRAELQELYFSYSFSDFNIKGGQQIIKWGSANSINPTSYFNPFDLSESFLKEEDELYLGVPSLSSLLMIGDYSLQLVLLPLHTSSRLPKSNSLWGIHFPSIQIDNPFGSGELTVPIEYNDNNSSKDFDIKNFSYGGRFAGTVAGIDLSISGYYGYDRDFLLFPDMKLVADPLGFKVVLNPIYRKVITFGLDGEYSFSKFTAYGEMTYSYNKSAVTDIKKTGELKARLEESGYVYGVVGVNWIYSDSFNVIIEYLHGEYIFQRDRYVDPFLSYLLSVSVEKKFFDNSLICKASGMYNVKDYSWIAIPSVSYRFENGINFELQGAFFQGEKDTLLGSYNSMDLLNVKVKYYF